MSQRRAIRVSCLDLVGFADLGPDGVPHVFRWRCRNQKCCPRREGMVAVHRLVLYGDKAGDLSTTYEPTRPLSELIDALPPERVGRQPAG